MPQPIGPHARAGRPPSPPPLVREAAGRDIWRDTSRLPQDGHFTSASSLRRTMSSSNDLAQGAHAYS